MSIRSEITRITNAVAAAYVAAQSKGATMPATRNVDNLDDCISSITFVTVRTGSSAPSDNLGIDNDIYIQLV